MRKNRLLFLLLIFLSNLQAVILSTDTFSNTTDSWTGGSLSSNTYLITRDGTGSKTYNFGSSYANKTVTINFNIVIEGGWETSGSSTDYLNVTTNGTTITNKYSDGSYTFQTITSVLDSAGRLTISVNPNTTSNTENVRIDNIQVSTISPSFSIADVTFNEGNSGIYSKNISVILSDTNGSILTVQYTTSNGTATAGSDYNATSGTLTFSGSTTTQNIPIQINGDTTTEIDETFSITLSNPTNGATISDNSATIKIVNDDGQSIHSGERNFLLRNPILSRNIRGNLKVIGNTVLCYKQNGQCVDTNSANNQVSLNFIDTNTITHTYNNSSQAQIANVPATAKVLWAGFYTQGHLGRNYSETTSALTGTPAYLTTPNGTSIAVAPQIIDVYEYTSDNYTYSTFSEIPSLVGMTGSQINGYFTGANIKAREGDDGGSLGYFGAWTLVVIYQDDTESLKNISVFDGYKRVSNDIGYENVDIPVSGFLTPTSGNVNSTLSVFIGEGDKNIAGDSIWLNNIQIPNADNDNAFNSTINGFIPNPNPVNFQGIDIHSYDVGVDGNTSHAQVIGNGATSATIRLHTEQYTDNSSDTYFPSMVAFTTELYEPRVCYVENYYDADGNATLTSANIGDTIMIKTWIANMKKDASDGNLETAQKVEITMEHDDTNLAYQTGTTKIQNIGESVYSTKTDATDSDIAKFTSDTNTSVWHIGTGATSTDGGNLTPNVTNDATNKVYISFKTKLLGSGDINISNVYKVSYENSNMGLRIGDESPVNIGVCKDFNTSIQIVQPPLGVFNVTNQNANVASGDPTDGLDIKNALWSQVSGKAFNVKIVALDSDKITPKNFTGNVILDLVNSTNITDEQSTCTNAPLLQQYKNPAPKTNLFNSESTKLFNLQYDKADQNTRFRVKFYDFSAIYALEGEPCKVSNTSANINGVPQCFNDMNKVQKYFPLCATPTTNVCVSSQQGGDDDWRCYECITGYNSPVCSRDNFSIRPATFNMGLNASKLIGGKQYTLDINATLLGSDTNVSGYNQSITNTSDKNSTNELVLSASCTTLGINRQLLTNQTTFTEGRSQTTHYAYNNVGNVLLTFNDNLWTQIDRSAYNTKTFSDCIENSSTNTANANGQVGCMVSGNKQFYFFPSKFTNTLTLQNFNNGNFTYLSNDGNMSSQLLFSPTAVIDDNITTATNYTAGCFARDIDYTVSLTNNPSIWQNGTPDAISRIRYFEDGNTSNFENNTTVGTATFSSTEGNFTSGTASNLTMLFNFSRAINKADEPFKIAKNDFNITQVIDDNGTIGSDFNRAIDQNTTFYYGRVYSTDYRGASPITTIRYEIYCKDCNKTNMAINGTQSPTSISWYQNPLHVNTDGNVTVFSSVGTTLINNANTTTSGVIASGIENNTLSLANGTNAPYTDRIQMTPSSWLLYNAFNANATSNNFNVEFIQSGNWAGQGTLGQTVDVNTSTRTNRRMEW